MAENNAGENAEVQFIEQDGEKYQADPENEGQPLKDDDGNPVPFVEDDGGEGDDEGNYVEIDGEKFAADPDNPEEALKDDEGNPVPFEEKAQKIDQQVDSVKPPVRDKKDFIINRLRQSRDSAKSKGKGDEDDDEVDEDEERIVKVIEKRFGAKFSQIDESENERELDNFFSKPENKTFKVKEEQIRKWWKDPSRNHLPVSSVAYEVMGQDLLKAGAKRQRAADDEADKTGGGGHSTRGSMGEKSVKDMTPEEFAAHQQKIRETPRN